ncbi:MAG: insulinase family protein [Marinicaulis sp.]|nr:insulinase family protein [Marinicaulis sp.]
MAFMVSLFRSLSALLALAALVLALGLVQQAQAEFEVPVSYHKLDNGLKVVLSEDHAVPTTTIAVYYGIGFRIEPRDRTGFAHLFEHMMFQGSKNLGKAEFIALVNSNGGVLNGSTRFDFTNYFEVVPSNKTETFIWAEADRMRGLDITQENLTNQQGVVKNEVKVNVLNQPYGGFPWLDLPQLANENWFNAHNFYGDLEDLDAATLEDVQQFFNDFYAPNNAVVVIAGDIDTEETLQWVEEYFGDIPASDNLTFPDVSEPKQTAQKRISKTDNLAPRPALAWAYHVPERGTPEWYAMIVIDLMLTDGDDSRFYQKFVQEKGYTGSVSGGINWPLGNVYNYNGPMIYSAFMVHDDTHEPDTILADLDAIVEDLQTNTVSDEEYARAMTKIRSQLYNVLGDGNRIGLVDLLAAFALFDDDPGRVNRLESEFDVVTPKLIQKTAQEYLTPENRSIITLVPGAGDASAGE